MICYNFGRKQNRWKNLILFFTYLLFNDDTSNIFLAEGNKPDDHLIFVLRGQVPDFRPRAVVDIGANAGKYTSFVHRMFPEASIFMIEADSMHEAKLSKIASDNNFTYQIAVLSEKDGEEVNWFGSGNTGNSMFREKTELYEGTEPATKISMTLDTLLQKEWPVKRHAIDLIKVDVQGAELVVFKGATETLKSATFVQIEASTISYNDGGACTWQVDAFLRKHGYALYELGEKQYSLDRFKTPGIGQYDVLYINTNKLPEPVQNASFCAGVPPEDSAEDYDDDEDEDTSFLENSLMELEHMVGINIPAPSSNLINDQKADSSNSKNNNVTVSQPCSQQQQSKRRRRHKHNGGFTLFIGIIIGYVICFLQMRAGVILRRRRIIQRED